VERVFSPLDEELELLPGCLTPNLQEDLVHLGTWMPFCKAVKELHYFRQTNISKSTTRRVTEAAGAAYVLVQNAEKVRIERELPEPPVGPAQQFLSVDGAMVPLVGGEWVEVRTLVIGDVLPPAMVKGERIIQTTNHSYFSRLADANSFTQLALVETQRRGVETAQAVAAVTDGAEWIQKFIDHHRQDAVRILDFPHAAEHLNQAAQALWGESGEEKARWLHAQLGQLKEQGAEPVLTTLRVAIGQPPTSPQLTATLAYLEKRQAQMDYPAFQAAGWPIGDGAVESANKGSGMHWSRSHVNPMLALRNIACNDRWEEAWPQLTATLRQQARQRHTHRRRAVASSPALPVVTPSTLAPDLSPPSPVLITPASNPPAKPPTAPRTPWRPPADHPWRRMPIGRSRFRPPSASTDAKL
jgi:hypothetical protein